VIKHYIVQKQKGNGFVGACCSEWVGLYDIFFAFDFWLLVFGILNKWFLIFHVICL